MNDLAETHISDAHASVSSLVATLKAKLVGREHLIERMVIALLIRGHVLIEGAPGLAKTRAVRLLADAIDAEFVRIQATPDLLPADLTGTMIFRPEKSSFEFSKGPLFHNIVLVDEINRAPPKVQSALLEAMGEQQITVGGNSHVLNDPFMVIATQNPIEHEGTYPLPEAQLDRFVFKVDINMPGAEQEMEILELVEQEDIKVDSGSDSGIETSRKVINVEHIKSAREHALQTHVSHAVKSYIVNLVTATRDNSITLIEHAASPRGSIALLQGAKTLAWLRGRDYVIPEDISELANDVLSVRVSLNYRARAEGNTTRSVIQGLLEKVAII